MIAAEHSRLRRLVARRVGSALLREAPLSSPRAKAADHAAALGPAQREAPIRIAPKPTAPRRCIGPSTTTTWSSCERLLAAGADVDGCERRTARRRCRKRRSSANVAVLRGAARCGRRRRFAERRRPDGAHGRRAQRQRRGRRKLLLEHGADVNAREHAQGSDGVDVGGGAEPARDGRAAARARRGGRMRARPSTTGSATSRPSRAQKNMPSGGFTPLLYAARQGCLECAKALVAAGADVDLTDPDGITPLLERAA